MQNRLGSLFLSTFVIFTAFFSFFIVFPLSVITGIIGASISAFYGNKATVYIRRRSREDSGANGAQDADVENMERPLTVAEIRQFFENSPVFRNFFGNHDENTAQRIEEIEEAQEVLESQGIQGNQETLEIQESSENQVIQENSEIQQNPEVQENNDDQSIQESAEIQQVQENRENQQIQENQESQNIPETPDVQQVQENQENQQIQENQGSQKAPDAPDAAEAQQIQENSVETQKTPEVQSNPEIEQIQENQENQAIQEIQNIPETPEVQQIQENSEETQETPEIQLKPDIQQIQENQENQQVQENQVIQEIQKIPEIPEAQQIQETPKTQQIQESQSIPETPVVQQIQENSENQEAQRIPVQDNQETPEIPENPENQEIQENPKIQDNSENQPSSENQVVQETQEILDIQKNQEIQENLENQQVPEIQQVQESQESQETPEIQDNQELPQVQGNPEISDNQIIQEIQENQENAMISAENKGNDAEIQEAISEKPETPSKAQENIIPKNSAENRDSTSENQETASGNKKNHSDSDLDAESNDVTHEEHQEAFRSIEEMLKEPQSTVKPNDRPLQVNPNFFEPVDGEVPIVERAVTPKSPVYIQNYLGTSDCENSAEHSPESSKVFDNSVYVVNFNEENESLSKVMDISQKSVEIEKSEENPSGIAEKLKSPSKLLQCTFVSTENLGNLENLHEKPADSDKKTNVIGVEQNLTDFLGTALEFVKRPDNLYKNEDLEQKIQGNTAIFEENVETTPETEKIVEYPEIQKDSLDSIPKITKASENPKPVPNPAETVDIPVKINEISSENKRIVENFLKNGHSPSKIMAIRLENEEGDEKPLLLQMQEATQQLDQVIAEVSRIPEQVEEFIERIENPTKPSPIAVRIARCQRTATSSSGEVEIPSEIAELMEHVKKLVEQQENEPNLAELPSLSPEIRSNFEIKKKLRDILLKQVDSINDSIKGVKNSNDQAETIEVPLKNEEKLENSTGNSENAENQTGIVVIPSEIEENAENQENLQKFNENSENQAETIEIPSENAENQPEVVIPSENAENQENIQNSTEKIQKSPGNLSVLTPTKKIFEKSQIPAQTPPGTPTKKASRFDEIVEKSSRNSSPRKSDSNGASARTAQRHFQTLQIPTEILTTNANLMKTPENLENFAQKLVDYSTKTSKSMCLVTIRDLATLTDLPISAESVSRITLKKKKVKVMKLANNDELAGNLADILEKVLENSSGAATWIHFLKEDESTSEQIAELYQSELKKIAREFYGESAKFAGNLAGINAEFLALSKDGYIWFNAGKSEF